MRELKTMEEAVNLIDEWRVAHYALLREFRRLERRCQEAEFSVEQHEFMLRHLDPFLPESMQDAKARAAEPKLYASIAALKAIKRRSPFDEPIAA